MHREIDSGHPVGLMVMECLLGMLYLPRVILGPFRESCIIAYPNLLICQLGSLNFLKLLF